MARPSEPVIPGRLGTDALPPRVVFYDGDCGLCARSVRWLSARDRLGRLHYAPLGGETARGVGHEAVMATGGAAGTLVYLADGAVYVRSRAVFALLREVRTAWRFLRVFRVLPAWLTDLPYRAIARVRYRLFGRAETCGMPSATLRARLLP
jgi:predicted DCC family thiol-disulfide oxidoreductase YuxK